MSSARSRIFPTTGHEQNAKRDGGDQFLLNHLSRILGNSAISFAYGSRISPVNQAPRCIWPSPPDNIPFPCRSLWISATCAIFSRLPKRGASAGRRIGWEFRNRVFRSKCGIWKQVFACLFFSAVGNGFCLLHGV